MCIPLIAAVVIATVLAVGLAVPALTAPISWLPETSEASALLGTLLTAQAAIAALTLAVTLFVMQGASARRDADARTYREYLRRSWVRRIFWSSLVAVGLTGLVLLIEGFAGASEVVARSFPGLRNLALLAAVAFLANLVLAVTLFERAARLALPERWRAIRRDVNERDVREAVKVFLERLRRESDSENGDGSDPTDASMDPGEGSANEAILALLDDGRRAMDERRPWEFARSLNSIRELIEHAMEEIEEAGIRWDAPALSGWPPLSEVRSNLDSFREEVIRRGDRGAVSELLSFDHWAVTNGTSRGCGDLLRVGLDGYDSNYRIAVRSGNSEVLESFFDQIWDWPYPTFSHAHPRDVFPYIREEMMLSQEHLLNDAMKADRTTDYEQMHERFEVFLRALARYWKSNRSRWPETEELYEQLAEHYRIALIGLGGRALLLADAGRINDPSVYIDVVRGAHPNLGRLADDVAKAVTGISSWHKTLWMEWEREGVEIGEVHRPTPHQYPLTWFTFRLMELSAEPNQTLDLRGCARLTLRWFEKNSVALAAHLRDVPAFSIEKRLEYATAALRAAACKEHDEEVAADYEIIGSDLNRERVSAFEADVRHGATKALTSIERLFECAGASLKLPSGAEANLHELRTHKSEPKAFFADLPEASRTPYRRPDGLTLGLPLSDEVISRFCETLDGAPTTTALLNAPESLLQEIDKAIEDIDPLGQLVIVLAGDWGFIPSSLRFNQPDGLQLQRNAPEPYLYGKIARYNGHPMLEGPKDGARRLYVVELQGWGRLVRAKSERDQGIVVKIEPVGAERAQVLLDSDTHHFPDDLDEISKLRKLQTRVEICVSARAEFRVTDPSRARRITGVQ